VKEAEEIGSVVLVAGHEFAEVEEPGEEALDLPSTLVTSQVASVLREDLAVGALRGDQRDPFAREPRVERVAVVGLVADEVPRPVASASEEAAAKKRFQELRLVGGSIFNIDGERKTRAVDHCHDLGPLAALGFADVEPPFLAPANVPSTNASSGSSLPRSRKSRASASTILRRVPSRAHPLKRRWHVAYGGYRAGMSFHGAPVRITQRTPLSTSRVGFHGRPLPSSRTGNGGINGSKIAHCSSVRSIPTMNHEPFSMEIASPNAQRSRSLTRRVCLWNPL
jgi:hypothetical protein